MNRGTALAQSVSQSVIAPDRHEFCHVQAHYRASKVLARKVAGSCRLHRSNHHCSNAGHRAASG